MDATADRPPPRPPRPPRRAGKARVVQRTQLHGASSGNVTAVSSEYLWNRSIYLSL
jgi:hypothetical protein